MKLFGGQQLQLAALIRTGVKEFGQGEEIITPIEEYSGVSLEIVEAAAKGDDVHPDDHKKLDEVLVRLEGRKG